MTQKPLFSPHSALRRRLLTCLFPLLFVGCASAPTPAQLQALDTFKASSLARTEQEVLVKLAQGYAQGVSLDTALNTQGHTALMQAVAQGHLQVVRFLIAHGADVNRVAEDGTTAVYLALEQYKERPALLEALAQARVDLNVLGPQGEPIATRFVRDARCDWLEWSREQGVDLNGRDMQGVPLAAKAWLSQDWSTALCLLKLGARFQYEGTNYALSKALSKDQTDTRSAQFADKKRVYQLAARAGIRLQPLPGQP